MSTKSFFVKLCLAASILFLAPTDASSQVTIGSATPPNEMSLLYLDAGILPRALHLPRLDDDARDTLINTGNEIIAKGLMIFNTDTRCLEFWNGEEWISLCDNVPHPPTCGVGGVAMRMRIGENYYDTHYFMTNGELRCWMVENSREGVPTNTPGVGTSNSIWNQFRGQAIGERGFYYGWHAARTACPPGWSLPTTEELFNPAGLMPTLDAIYNENSADSRLRFWFGSSALAGARSTQTFEHPQAFENWDELGGWWTYDDIVNTSRWALVIMPAGFPFPWGNNFPVGDYMSLNAYPFNMGFSVRCIRDRDIE